MSFLDLSKVETNTNSVLKEGTYMFKCQDAELKSTKAGNGRYIKVKLREMKSGAILFHNFNIDNPSEKAQQIGLAQLKSFLAGSGYHNPDTLESVNDLIGLQCEAKTKVKSDEKYGESAEISYFKVAKEEKVADDDTIPF